MFVWGSALGGLTALRLVVAAFVPLAPDEAYYWVWSRALAPGYLDHPPMVALWIWLGTAIAGDGSLGVRLLAPVAAALGSLLLAQAGEDLFPGRRAGLTGAILLNATLLFGVGAVTITPDTPLLFFWTGCLWAMARLHRSGRGVWWLVGGLCAGLAMDSKYTAILLPVGLGLWCLCLPAQRAWLRRPMPWLGAGLGALSFLPVLLWNAAHGWASFARQGGRGFVWHPAGSLRYLGELVGGQIGLATPLVFLLCVSGIVVCFRRARREARAAEGLVAALTVPGIVLFVQHALGDRVQANWPAVIYPAAALGVAGLAPRWQRLVAPGAALGGVMTGLVYVQAVWHPFALGRADPTARLEGWNDLAREVNATAARSHAAFVSADNYGVVSELARSNISVPVLGIEPRWELFDLPRQPAGETGLLVVREGSTDRFKIVSVTGGGAILPRR